MFSLAVLGWLTAPPRVAPHRRGSISHRHGYITMLKDSYDLVVLGGGPVGLDTLAAAVGEDKGTLEDVVEPFLIHCGFLARTPRGRVATERAFAHLGVPYSAT